MLLFTSNEHNEIVSNYPNFESYFCEIEDKWFLVEQNKCRSEDLDDYILISNKKQHINCFENEDEESIITFINDLSKMLPKDYLSSDDTNDEYKKKCFNYSRLMNEMAILFIQCFNPYDLTDLNKVAKDILNKAVRYNIIKKEDFTNGNDLDALYIIAFEAKDIVFKY